MDDFLVKPVESTSKTTDYFTILGDQDYLDAEGFPRSKEDGPKVLARRVNYFDSNNQPIPAKTLRYIKIGAHGHVYNPMGLYTEGLANKINKKIGRDEFVLRKVNEYSFNLYIQFLKTKNPGHLALAERELS